MPDQIFVSHSTYYSSINYFITWIVPFNFFVKIFLLEKSYIVQGSLEIFFEQFRPNCHELLKNCSVIHALTRNSDGLLPSRCNNLQILFAMVPPPSYKFSLNEDRCTALESGCVSNEEP